ncbi:MAG: hypothetical protein RQ899_14900 [Pseudomonadales bacterium]|nr:hypothetical protein [Pseudomonadales bacterium]
MLDEQEVTTILRRGQVMQTNRRLAAGVEKVTRRAYRPLFLIIGVFSGLVSVASRADVPNTFVDGTPAVAGEVNANFDNLDQRLENLESLGLADRLSVLENLDPPEITVDCDTNPGALQAAIDAASPLGLSIQVSGSCGAVEIFNKRNLFIDGGDKSSTTITASTELAALGIALSQGVFIDNVTAVGSNEEPAIIVGASVVILGNITATNGPNNDGTVTVAAGSYTVFDGDIAIGSADGSDPVALQLSERGSVIIENALATIKGVAAIAMEQQSLFDHDPSTPADILNIEGNVGVGSLSTFEMNHGSIQGNTNILGGSNFLARAETGYNISIDGNVNSSGGGSTFTLATVDEGTASLAGTYTANFSGGGAVIGAGTVFSPATVNVASASRLLIQGGAVIGDGETNPEFNVNRFSILTSFSELDPVRVTCNGTVVAQQLAPEFLDLYL